MISLEKLKILTPLQKLPKNVGDLGKLIAAKGFEKLPKVQKSPNLVTLAAMDNVGSPLHTGTIWAILINCKHLNKNHRGYFFGNL